MIISQTPYRVSFAGGGIDLPAFELPFRIAWHGSRDIFIH